MARIHVLDDATIDKIAAGEVVERPASVVKELVENSLDSGATSIIVSIENGGIDSVSVRDDGCGMSPEDARAAFARHATSKIRRIEDLEKLGSYGFRGEALSSIAAVSRVTMRTREHDSEEGTMAVVQGGKLEGVSTVGCPVGTEVVVDDLFYNVPARRKSLKSRKVELAHCKEVMANYMLCRPGLSFTFRSDDETELVHVLAEGMRGSLLAAYGPKVADNMMSGEAEAEGIRVESHIARLEHTRSAPTELKLFVNDRPVRNSKLTSSVVSAYGSKLMKDRYPMGVVRIFLEGSLVDVNVHPSKREVRFADEALVSGLVAKSVGNALERPDLSYRYDLTKFSEAFEGTGQMPEIGSTEGVQTFLPVSRASEPGQQQPSIVPLAQVMDTYILAESKGNLLLVDQHAASERVVYEAILASIDSGREFSQRLLTPLVLNLTSSEARVFEENRAILERAGFTAEPFGKGAFALRSIPTVLGVAQGEWAFRNLLGDLGQMSPERRLGLDVIWRVACHTAVRAGDRLSEGQMRQLLADLVRTKSPYTCEHGRPTMIVLSPVDLEKLFKRRL
ncbi:MAG TPA: DNA mismatch repair endonuclease MutL [Thermoplasmata archaeon]